MTDNLPIVVEVITDIRFDGNITPHSWFQHHLLRTEANKPNKVAMDLLADIIYWYRASVLRDEASGRVVSRTKKFEADRWRIDYQQWADLHGYGKRQVQDAATFLEQRGIIKKFIEDHVTPSGYKIHNAVFLEPVPSMIHELNQVPANKGGYLGKAVCPEKTGYGVRKNGTTEKPRRVAQKNVGDAPKKGKPRTEIPSETPPEIPPTTNRSGNAAPPATPVVGGVYLDSQSERRQAWESYATRPENAKTIKWPQRFVDSMMKTGKWPAAPVAVASDEYEPRYWQSDHRRPDAAAALRGLAGWQKLKEKMGMGDGRTAPVVVQDVSPEAVVEVTVDTYLTNFQMLANEGIINRAAPEAARKRAYNLTDEQWDQVWQRIEWPTRVEADSQTPGDGDEAAI